MEHQKWGGALRLGSGWDLMHLLPVSFLAFSLLLCGCASPGDPTPRRPPQPQAITDLAANQLGNEVILTFTLPNETIQRRPLKEAPSVLIYRDFVNPGDKGNPAQANSPVNPALLVTIPPALVASYNAGGRVRYEDSLKPEVFAQHPTLVAVYTVRTAASEKRMSDNSNQATLEIFPWPAPISDLRAEATRGAVMLHWTPAQQVIAGEPVQIAGYRVYRSVCEPVHDQIVSESAECLSMIGEVEPTAVSFSDTKFEWGKTYTYFMRSFRASPKGSVESSSSNLATLSPENRFPPAAPSQLIVVFVAPQGETPGYFDLSWAINMETDIAGYNVYRSEQGGASGARLNTELLPTPAFQDKNVQSGHGYLYKVTAVDQSGNESPASAAVPGTVPTESQQSP